MNPLTFNPYNSFATFILYSLLIFTPLARGSVHLWTQSVICIGSFLAIAALLLEVIQTNQPKLNKTKLFLPIATLLIWFSITLISGQYQHIGFTAAQLLFSYISIFYITIHTVRTRRQQRFIVYLLIAIALFLAIFGFFQRLELNPFPWWDYVGVRENYTFLRSTYVNRNHLAGYLEMSLPLLIALFLTRSRMPALLIMLLCLFIILVTAHTMTLSRGGWISLSLSMIFMGTILYRQKPFKRKKLLLAIAGIMFTLFLFVMTGTNLVERMLTLSEKDTITGLNGRSIAWQGTFKMIADNPCTGTGPGTFATMFTQYQPPGIKARFFYSHNDYLQYTAEFGFPILILMGWFLYTIFKTGFRKLKSRSRQTWAITLAAMTGFVAILIHSFVDFNLHIPANAILLVVLTALIIGEVGSSKRRFIK